MYVEAHLKSHQWEKSNELMGREKGVPLLSQSHNTQNFRTPCSLFRLIHALHLAALVSTSLIPRHDLERRPSILHSLWADCKAGVLGNLYVF